MYYRLFSKMKGIPCDKVRIMKPLRVWVLIWNSLEDKLSSKQK